MRSIDELLLDAAAMHRGCICAGQVLGVRMGMLGCELLGIEEPTHVKRLIVYVEIDRCMADAIAAVTGCRLGKRTLKHIDYGKCACTFVDIPTSRAFRISARNDARSRVWDYAPLGLEKSAAQREAYKIMPNGELFFVEEVRINIADHDQPGHPISRVMCAICMEEINDRREVRLSGQVLCRACAQGAYYQELSPYRARVRGDYAKSHQRIRMINTGRQELLIGEVFHPISDRSTRYLKKSRCL